MEGGRRGREKRVGEERKVAGKTEEGEMGNEQASLMYVSKEVRRGSEANMACRP